MKSEHKLLACVAFAVAAIFVCLVWSAAYVGAHRSADAVRLAELAVEAKRLEQAP
jgi:hypothetical protein